MIIYNLYINIYIFFHILSNINKLNIIGIYDSYLLYF